MGIIGVSETELVKGWFTNVIGPSDRSLVSGREKGLCIYRKCLERKVQNCFSHYLYDFYIVNK